MFQGLTTNRGEWKALADAHEAKMKAIDDEKKKLEGGKHFTHPPLMCLRVQPVFHCGFFSLLKMGSHQRRVLSARKRRSSSGLDTCECARSLKSSFYMLEYIDPLTSDTGSYFLTSFFVDIKPSFK